MKKTMILVAAIAFGFCAQAANAGTIDPASASYRYNTSYSDASYAIYVWGTNNGAGLVQFELPTVPAGEEFATATLRFNVNAANNGSVVKLYHVAPADSAAATGIARDDKLHGTEFIGDIDATLGDFTFDVAQFLNGDLANGNQYACFSFETIDSAKRNILTSTVAIDYTTAAAAVPEPATLALLAMGGIGVLSRKRRK